MEDAIAGFEMVKLVCAIAGMFAIHEVLRLIGQ